MHLATIKSTREFDHRPLSHGTRTTYEVSPQYKGSDFIDISLVHGQFGEVATGVWAEDGSEIRIWDGRLLSETEVMGYLGYHLF